jgi:urease accessory protein
MTSLVVLLHLCDSLFPLGSFSHSDGLEAATSQDEVTSPDDLRSWMDVTLTEGLGRSEGPAVARAWTAFTDGQFEELSSMDDEIHALRPTSGGRTATRAMGSRLLKTWQHIRPDDRLISLLGARTAFTLPVAFGIVSAAASIPVRSAVEGFMYTRLAAVISTAMRLMPLGQHEGHALLADILMRVPAVADGVLRDEAPFRSFTPELDRAAMSQQFGQSRLFRS